MIHFFIKYQKKTNTYVLTSQLRLTNYYVFPILFYDIEELVLRKQLENRIVTFDF